MKNDPENDARLRDRLKEAVERFAGGSADKFGRLIGYANGGYIREVLDGRKPVRSAIIDRTHSAGPDLVGWFADDAGFVAELKHYRVSNVESGPTPRGKVPLISWVQAGAWNGANDHLQPGEAERWLDCPAGHSTNSYALRVRGDSMQAQHGRTYPEGCIIFVDPAKRSPVNGARIIAKLEGSDEVTFKVFKQEDGRMWLQPLNSSHRPIYEPFKVLGTVIGKWEDE